MGAELLCADRRTDMEKLTVVFSCFSSAPKIASVFVLSNRKQCQVDFTTRTPLMYDNAACNSHEEGGHSIQEIMNHFLCHWGDYES